jgi:RimJ/RimL family protein N-acetyltransferase
MSNQLSLLNRVLFLKSKTAVMASELDSLTYRPVSEKDFDAVYDLYMDGASNSYLTYDPMDKIAFGPIFHKVLATNTLYVAELNKEVIATYRLIPKTDRQADTIYLGGFSVKPSLKGKGFGTKILTHIKNEAAQQGKKRIELTVDIANETAINLYKKTGFEIEGHIRMSYKRSDTGAYYDEYLMGLIL